MSSSGTSPGLSPTEKKRRAAEAAMSYVRDGMLLGVGTGSTVGEFIEVLKARKIRLQGAVSSSRQTSERLKAAGIEVLDLNDAGELALYIDGADEATPSGMLIKGGGAALTREKIVAAASRRFVCIIDDSKLVEVLGAFPLPVEVIPMARCYVARELAKLGGLPAWREGVVTDNGNHILDVRNLRIEDPEALESAIDAIAGVVTVGLFAHRRADVMLVAGDAGIRTIEP
ncbi:MAG TPA: ribose-5-phosphate isomerase RpiA [Steroidobacteraceae bacterium]|jgi:ribose 5-phosphate isomerase A|nr:ribose-5-phosphate isomerase RpiA [Steroidobacteraceae bacterium]